MLAGRLKNRAWICPEGFKSPPGIGFSRAAEFVPTPLHIRLTELDVPLITYRRGSNSFSPSPTHQVNPPEGSADFDPPVIIQLPLSQRCAQLGISIDLSGTPPCSYGRLKRGEIL